MSDPLYNKLAFNGVIINFDQYRGPKGQSVTYSSTKQIENLVQTNLVDTSFPDAQRIALAFSRDGDRVTSVTDLEGNLLWDRTGLSETWPW